MSTLLHKIIMASEKAANIARVCRDNQNLFKLLVEEKKSDEANSRFIRDFKTLADVLIQETIRHDIQEDFPGLGKRIFGEESNIFTNTLGETIAVTICSSRNETAINLELVLDGNSKVAATLAEEVHRTVSLADVNGNISKIPSHLDIDVDTIGIWIDPIDSTAEYISAKEEQDECGIYLSGLQCVTVLIGAYDRSGNPIIGVINQPFHQQNNSQWRGECYWGLNTPELKISSLCVVEEKSKIIALSKIETETLKSNLRKEGFSLKSAAGAGYKLLSVITGLSDAYILSQGTTFRWDVCGPHAILKALGGGIFNYAKALEGEAVEIDYTDVDDETTSTKTKSYCNKDGIIAVRDKVTLEKILKCLK